MKIYGGMEIQLHLCDFCTIWRRVVSFTLLPLHPSGKSTRYPLIRNWVDHRVSPNVVRRNEYYTVGNQTRGQVAHCYTFILPNILKTIFNIKKERSNDTLIPTMTIILKCVAVIETNIAN
jgi:hypothetical protein